MGLTRLSRLPKNKAVLIFSNIIFFIMGVSRDWSEIVNKGMQAAHAAYMETVRAAKPTNPRSPTYSKEISEWQNLLRIPQIAQAEGIDGIRKSHNKARNSSSDAELEKVKKELAKANESKSKMQKDFVDLEKRYKELDGKVKSKSRK